MSISGNARITRISGARTRRRSTHSIKLPGGSANSTATRIPVTACSAARQVGT
jgi:hypothetical protein